MVNDAVFRSALAWLAAMVLLVGLCTQSFKKMLVTYILGMFAISGVLLPDWEFFDRRFSQWRTPLTVDEKRTPRSARTQATPTRFRIHPIRVAIYTIVYGFGFYKWWMFVST
ncbi:unnamed protein product [Coffea canephora]|uniref:Signal peptidase complex-like protein DTM1 n=1 Tax=Coffea canephora TaxID=49390 RepID=A0A068U0B6_COFCA|nr:unnamed protein product [Coffea canephora]